MANTVVGERDAVLAAAAKAAQGWDFADALHHALSIGCDDFVTLDAARILERISCDLGTGDRGCLRAASGRRTGGTSRRRGRPVFDLRVFHRVFACARCKQYGDSNFDQRIFHAYFSK